MKKTKEVIRTMITEYGNKMARFRKFLNDYTPAILEERLNNCIIGQPEMVKAVADFLYYHVLRYVHPELPVRNLLIAGSSGSGKTEVFRRVKEMFGRVVNVTIADGSRITKEGWSGNYKLQDMLSPDLDILVIDEADKLCKPSYSTNGVNVAEEMQGEFLKLMEGEYEVVARRKEPAYKIENLSVVLVGAFEGISEEKKKKSKIHTIGFGGEKSTTEYVDTDITDEDLIHFGLMPELVGRISVKVTTNELTDTDYLTILQNSRGRVANMLRVLAEYDIQVDDVFSKETIMRFIEQSRTNRTGFRWVSAQIENLILESIREKGVQCVEPVEVFEELDEGEWCEMNDEKL